MKKLKNFYQFMKLVLNLSRISKNANNTNAAIAVADSLYQLGVLKLELEKISSDTQARQWLSSRRMMNPYDIQKLNEFPPGTLAKAYAEHMLSRNLIPDFYTKIEVVNDSTYIMMRLRETHDLWHVVTGFNTDVPGELGLQAFSFANIHSPLAPILIAARSLMSIFKDPQEVLATFDQVARGWTMGKKAHDLFSVDWESHWGTPVEEIRRLLNLDLAQ